MDDLFYLAVGLAVMATFSACASLLERLRSRS